MIDDQELDTLNIPKTMDVGTFCARKSKEPSRFLATITFAHLAVLIKSAFDGHRVYEFLSIQRPGDLLPYVSIDLSQSSVKVIDHLRMSIKNKPSRTVFSFSEMERCFVFEGDDTYPVASAWLRHRNSSYWGQILPPILIRIRRMQARLKQSSDFLLRHEIDLIDKHLHRRDFMPDIERLPDKHLSSVLITKIQPDVIELIDKLISQDIVQSVSCPFDDFRVWRLLVTEQVRRSLQSGKPLQQAFTLCGPDSGLHRFYVEDWGGAIHIPFEGACGSDLLITPKWMKLKPEAAMGKDGSLSRMTVGRRCHYILTDKDYGELDSATRDSHAGWHLYRSRLPYMPSNPLAL